MGVATTCSMRMNRPTRRDERRLRDGATAAALPADPQTAEEIRSQLVTLHDGICALQSTDDLGSPEANQRTWDDMLALQERHKALVVKLAALETHGPV